MNVRDLTIKFLSYAHYTASREWAGERSMLPLLVCIAPDIAQERRIQRVAQAKLTSTPELELWTTTEVLLNKYGPLAPIWLQGIPQRRKGAQPGGSLDDQQRDAGSRRKLPIAMESVLKRNDLHPQA